MAELPYEMKRLRHTLITIAESDPRPLTYTAKVFHKTRYDAVAQIIRESVGTRIDVLVDVGCGYGVTREWLEKFGIQIGSYIGCDIDPAKLEQSLKAEKVLCDARNLPFRKCTAEASLMSEVLEHIKRPYLAFVELLRVSKNYCFVTLPEEKLKNILGFRYPEHISDISQTVLNSLARKNNYILVSFKKLYFLFPPSVLDRLRIPFSQITADILLNLFKIVSKTPLRNLSLIKNELVAYSRVKKD